MDFIRKNWSRLSLALLFLLGGILGIIAMVNSDTFKMFNLLNGYQRFYAIAMVISAMVYFFGMMVVTILKCVAGKKMVSATYMIIGGIVTILEVVVLCVCVNAELISLSGTNSAEVFFEFIVPLIVFGLYPLVKGTTRFIEAEHTPIPAKAAAQPAAAEPAKATAPAPKKATKTAAK